jgi:hypothetical protein
MSDARDKRAVEIQDVIRQILRYDWNPIGFDVPLDEYDSYIAPVYRILASSRSEEDLIKYLDWTACDTIFGMPEKSSNSSRDKLRPLAQKLLALDVKL